MNNKGYSLLELMISLAIMVIVLLMVSFTFQQVSRNVKSQNARSQGMGDNISATELLRLDLDHAGFGIPSFIGTTATPNTELPIAWDNTNKELTVLSTFNPTNPDTWGWAVGECNGNTLNDSLNPENISLTAADIKLINANSVYAASLTEGICIALPHDGLTDCAATGSVNCTEITYELSTSQNLSECVAGTLNLERNGTEAFSCVADFITLFDWDTDGNDTIDTGEHNIEIPSSVTTTTALRSDLKRIQSYILVQVGKRDSTYDYGNAPDTTTGDIDIAVGADTMTFTTTVDPDEFVLYHWEVIKITSAFRRD